MMPAVSGLFSKRLAKARREAGFKSAYQFYHDNGGRRHFPFTYVHYLRLEKGGALPRPEWLQRLLLALRLSPGAAGCRDFFLDYLKDMLGGQETFDLVLNPLLGPHAGPAAPAGTEAVRWMKSQHAIHLTPEQFKVLAGDEAAYWCSEVLCNDGGTWSAEELAKTLGLGVKDVRAGLARLKAAGLARRTASGRFSSRSAGKLYTFPGRLQGMGPALKRVQAFWERMRRRRGQDVVERVELVRAESAFIRRYAASLAETLDAANAGASHGKGEDTGFYLVEAGIRKLLPF